MEAVASERALLPGSASDTQGTASERNGSQYGRALDDVNEVEHVFKFAGATCTLTVHCTNPGAPYCNTDFLHTLEGLLVIAQEGNR